MSRFYITTAIDYANGDPHLGHAFEKIGADVIARFHRLRGDDVHFMIGMDEHGQKVAQAADAAGVEPQALTDDIADRFRAVWRRLDVAYDQFIRTTDAHHKRGVRALIDRIADRAPDDFYEQAYEGWYCVGCELFKRDDEIVDGRCVLHPTRDLQWTEERNWFFRLSRYQNYIERLLAEHPDFLQPDSRRNEVLSLVRGGLEDISVSRARLAWAVPFPRPTSDGVAQGVWVWFDALPNYLTGTGYPDDGWETRWPAQLHVIGKDITRLHAVIWPAMLEAAGLPRPEHVWAHGFVLLAGERFSKSAGVRLDLGEAIDRYGADAFRYFLLREVPFDADGSFSYERFEERYNADLANAFGNLVSRTVAMIEKYCDSVVPAGTPNAVDEADATDLRDYARALDGSEGYLLQNALRSLWLTIARANEYIDRQAPWKLARDPGQRAALEATLASLVRQLIRQAVHLVPFMPGKAEALWSQLGAPGRADAQRFDTLPTLDPTGWRVRRDAPLFPKDPPATTAG